MVWVSHALIWSWADYTWAELAMGWPGHGLVLPRPLRGLGWACHWLAGHTFCWPLDGLTMGWASRHL
jgi:hypothetical protein